MSLNKNFHIQTFGCAMNEHDSETIAGMLSELGYRENKDKSKADIAIINTCSIRDNADQKFYGILGQLKKIKENNKDFTVCLCGCMMQQQHVIDTVKQKYPWVDIIFGTHNIHEFPKILTAVISEKQKRVDVWAEAGEIIEGLPAKRIYPFKAFVNIIYGCNNFCTYCIVPYTRGRERSRMSADILKEVTELVADGVKEITLLGQNVNSYSGDVDFPGLIYLLNEIEGLERIRFMTSHPKDLSDGLIQAYLDCEKLCDYIHLPVQSGSTNVLQQMNRKYSKEDYINLISRLRSSKPEIAITTDIIVGFPGETEEDFQETLDLVKNIEFDAAFTFLYSIRKGTPAEKYENQIPEAIKHERFNRLVTLLNEISLKKNRELEGSIVKVLVEGYSKTKENTLTGRTEGFKSLNFKGEKELIGSIVTVKVTEGKTFILEGKKYSGIM